MYRKSGLRLYRVAKRGRSTYLGSYVSVAVGILPEANPGEPRRGVHIQLQDATQQNHDHRLSGLPDAGEALIEDLALAVASARTPNGLRGSLDSKRVERNAKIDVLMKIVDRLSAGMEDELVSLAPAFQQAAE